MDSYKEDLKSLNMEEVPENILSDNQKLLREMLTNFFLVEKLTKSTVNREIFLINSDKIEEFKKKYNNFRFARKRASQFNVSVFSLIATITYTLTGHYLGFITNPDTNVLSEVVWLRGIS